MRRLWYDTKTQMELDNLLLILSQVGVFIYAAFSIIGTFHQLEDHLLAFLASLATLIQTTIQTVFILDASSRWVFDINLLFIEIKDSNLYQSIILSSFTDIILLLNLRYAYTPKQVRNKPGREVVTFLLVCNLAMWAINTLETNRADSHPIQVIIASLIIIFVLKMVLHGLNKSGIY